jgi:hypothetical protein
MGQIGMAIRTLLRRGPRRVLFCMDAMEEGTLGGSYAKLACKTGLRTLIFVRRGVAYCSAVARATAALLGRFLPRLGPLAPASGPFFCKAQIYSAAARYGRSCSSGISPRRFAKVSISAARWLKADER